MDLPQRSILGHPGLERRNLHHFFPRTVCNVSAMCVCVWGGVCVCVWGGVCVCVWGGVCVCVGWGGEEGKGLRGVFTNRHKK